MSRRLRIIVAVLVGLALILAGRLAWVQLAWGPSLQAQAEEQRARVYVEPARRGMIVDHAGNELAYTMQARSLTVSPNLLRDELREREELEMQADGSAEGLSAEELNNEVTTRVEDILEEMATTIPEMISDTGASSDKVDKDQIHDKLTADSSYEVLVRNVDPDVAAEVANRFHGVAADHQDIRQYPNGAIAENVLGRVSMDGEGQFGLEASADHLLSGINGRSTEDIATTGQVIPGTLRDQVPAVDGTDLQLTLDLDLQTFVQQKLEQAKANSGAESAEAVVLDVQTAEVLAMANTDTINPNKNVEEQIEDGKSFENSTISHPYEPGSVGKIITAAGAINDGVTTPDEMHYVPGSIDMAGVTVSDAWEHAGTNYTTTGIFGKSSNVGTLMLAQRLGEERFDHYLDAFGIGETTGIELPSESPGLRPPLEQWSGGTFANLPIGQGMSWTTLQMASVFQTVANDGERIEPRIIGEQRGPDGEILEQEEPERTQVISPEAARTVTDMFRATLQSDPAGIQSGTAAASGIEGYQLSGKTGTAQKVDPDTGAYSNSAYWITFAGIAPADDPRFVVAVMIDEPERGVEEGGGGGQSAAPVFQDIAGWLLDKENIPPSPEGEPLVLQGG
ncbi:cell division protein FtsI [Corynebacterium yudongzhengii]|uniref:Penicillin-binding protein 2 n=1 Tax=Corynebacterium yudongzhengii TaxID=2080740 RepID=A0A2U1T786_9CORY|nr:penicillin-binding protein 2 [Corynebacterium yudongzhengii]AWB81566.1 cell division protein FtsI [Corynebacterium yudongzhengii]PWC01864.1 penicillin-binding protein 2 [Corynebacterium yudongzhengii]